MIFETLNESNERGELLLVEHGMCHFHVRRDGQLTIREIIVQRGHQGHGIGRGMVQKLEALGLEAGVCSPSARLTYRPTAGTRRWASRWKGWKSPLRAGG